MFLVILYMLRQTVGHRAPPLPFPSFLPSYCDVSQALSYFASTISQRRAAVSSECFSVIYFTIHAQTDCWTLRSPLLFPPFLPSYCDVSQALSYFASTIHENELFVTWKMKNVVHFLVIFVTTSNVSRYEYVFRNVAPFSLSRVVRTSETSVYSSETTRGYIPEVSHLHTQRRENLKSYDATNTHIR
jgi:hypothetical protein